MFQYVSKLKKLCPSHQKRNLTISYPFEATEFWNKNDKLIQKRLKNEPLFVFFEGVPGCGKRDTLKRLSKVSHFNNPFEIY